MSPIKIVSKEVLELDKRHTFIVRGIFSARKEEESATRNTCFT